MSFSLPPSHYSPKINFIILLKIIIELSPKTTYPGYTLYIKGLPLICFKFDYKFAFLPFLVFSLLVGTLSQGARPSPLTEVLVLGCWTRWGVFLDTCFLIGQGWISILSDKVHKMNFD